MPRVMTEMAKTQKDNLTFKLLRNLRITETSFPVSTFTVLSIGFFWNRFKSVDPNFKHDFISSVMTKVHQKE
jgi:hypothetical protein